MRTSMLRRRLKLLETKYMLAEFFKKLIKDLEGKQTCQKKLKKKRLIHEKMHKQIQVGQYPNERGFRKEKCWSGNYENINKKIFQSW